MNCESAPLGALDKAPVQIDVVAGLVGFDTGAYSIGYIAGWADADTALIKSTAGRVLRTAHEIAGILTPSNEKDNDDTGASPRSDDA
jgi:5-formyltetrahydrofolate cyclo-ligase